MTHDVGIGGGAARRLQAVPESQLPHVHPLGRVGRELLRPRQTDLRISKFQISGLGMGPNSGTEVSLEFDFCAHAVIQMQRHRESGRGQAHSGKASSITSICLLISVLQAQSMAVRLSAQAKCSG